MKTVLIGVGNILFMDEGIGVYAAKLLACNYTFTPEIEIIDGGTLGFKLMDYLSDYEKVIILDTVSIEADPGSVYDLPSDALMNLGEYRQTVHEIEVVGMIEMCQLLGKMAEVNIIGIIPQDIVNVEINLSNSIKSALPFLIQTTLNNLKKSGIYATAKKQQKSIEEIIDFYQNPLQNTPYNA
jgi:hydrogenase maturation protease